MPSKLIFCVGHIGACTNLPISIASNYAASNLTATTFQLGVKLKLQLYGLRPAETTFQKIEEIIAEHPTIDALIFTGPRIVEHISEIYNQYPDAVFAFGRVVAGQTSDVIETQKEKAATFVPVERIAEIVADQIQKIENLIIDNNLVLIWKRVDLSTLYFKNFSVVETEAGILEIAVNGLLP
jgi:hypothetical protein